MATDYIALLDKLARIEGEINRGQTRLAGPVADHERAELMDLLGLLQAQRSEVQSKLDADK